MPLKGRKFTKQHKKKLSESHKELFRTGKRKPLNYWLGKKRPQSVGIAVSKSNKEKIGEKSRNWKGGMTFNKKEYRKKIREKQAGRKKPEQCELCGAMGQIVFDHDHKTGKFRGWICHRCNITLGFVKDNIELLNEMIEYLIANK